MIRHKDNPILTRQDIPLLAPHLVDVSSVFNPGAVRIGSEYLLLLRVQNRGRETFLMTARGPDGIAFRVDPGTVAVDGLDRCGLEVYHLYDPRITSLDDRWIVTFSLDTPQGGRVGLARTDDFRRLEFIGLIGDGDIRNGVLIPGRPDGKYMAYARPNRIGANGIAGSEICLYESDDLTVWHECGVVLTGRPHYWDERIGPGPSPIATAEGWLLVYHGVATHFDSVNIYQAGAALFDRDNPGRLIARSRYNILEPREPCELMGQVPNVVFPTGLLVDETTDTGLALPQSRVLIYYGAADTVVCVAETTVADLIRQCHEGNDRG